MPSSMPASRSAPMTSAPASRKQRTSAWPMPPPAPEISTVLPSSRNGELMSGILVGDAFDLDLAIDHHVALDSSPGGRVIAKIAFVDGVEAPEVAGIIEPDTAADDMFEAVAGFFENGDEVLDREVGLLDDANPLDFSILHRDLARDEEEATRFHGAGK